MMHAELRRAVVDYAVAHPAKTFVGSRYSEWMNGALTEDHVGGRTYAQFMGSLGTYAGTFEAHVAGIILRREVCIRSPAIEGWQRFGAAGTPRLFLQHTLATEHYSVLVPRD